MPYKKNYRKRTYKKKPYRKTGKGYRRRYRRGVGTTIERQLVISDRKFIKVKYNEVSLARTVLTIPVGGQYTINTYNANDIRQHYPLGNTVMPGIDEWAKFYARYRVHAVKVKVAMVSNDGSSTGDANKPLMGFIHLQSDPAPNTFASWDKVRQFNGNRYSVFKPLAITAAGGQVQPTYLKKFYRLKNVVGNKLSFKVDDTYEGTFGSVPGGAVSQGPARVFNYYVGIMTMDGTDVTGAAQNVSVMLTTTLYVELKDRIDLTS